MTCLASVLDLALASSQGDLLSDSSDNSGTLMFSQTANLAFPLYRIEFDEWGLARRDCGGFGFCNANDCWFKSDCPDPLPPSDTTTFVTTALEMFGLDNGNRLARFTLSQEHYQLATTGNPTGVLVVEEDLIAYSGDPSAAGYNKATVPAGDYPYIASIGLYGGYEVQVHYE